MSDTIKPACLLDNCVLQCAIFAALGIKVAHENKDKLEASAHLVSQLPRIRISAVTWTEINRNLTVQARNLVNSWKTKIRIIPVDEAIAFRATELLDAKLANPIICKKCYNDKSINACSVCGTKLSRPHHIVDAMVLATAELRKDVDVLYTYDNGIHAYIGLNVVQGCYIWRPPHPNGPLFAHKTEANKAAVLPTAG